MTRGVGAIRLLQQLVPGWAIPLFVFVTYLGSLWILVPLLTLLYWRWDTERTAFVGSAVLGGAALAFTLKNAFALARPPVSLHLVHATGYGFPSGHAIDSTVTYGALASVVRAGTRLQRLLFGAGLVGLVALSRVVLGVHFAIDVAVGIGVGLAYLFVVVAVLDRQVVPTLLFATALAATGVIMTGGVLRSTMLLGCGLVALAAWVRRERADV